MKPFHRIIPLTLIFFPFLAAAQEVEMADTFRSEGKIYIVISVISVILAGIFIYLFFLERKISRLERKMNESK